MTDTQQEQEQVPEMDDERFEQLRRDPRVIIHRRKATQPFTPILRVNPDVDILELLDRRDPEDEPNTHHGS